VEWRGRINAILYGLIFTKELDGSVVRRMADALIDGRAMPGGPDSYYTAIEPALRSGEPLNDMIQAPHSEEAIRDFLARLAVELDARRPWPQSS
jgi:hypothetical protein